MTVVQAATLACDCGHEWMETDEDNLMCEWHVCPKCKGMSAEFKFFEAPCCENCKTVGWQARNVAERWCSRRCQLQGEYAEQLGKGQA